MQPTTPDPSTHYTAMDGKCVSLAYRTINKVYRRRTKRTLSLHGTVVIRRGRWVEVSAYVPELDQAVCGLSRCSDADTFNLDTGVQVAAKRAAEQLLYAIKQHEPYTGASVQTGIQFTNASPDLMVNPNQEWHTRAAVKAANDYNGGTAARYGR